MRPKRKDRGLWSAWEYLGPTLEAVERANTPEITSSEMAAVMTAAIDPGALASSIKSKPARALATTFASAYGQRPDLVLKLIAAARKRWTSAAHRAAVHRFIATQPWVQVSEIRRAINIGSTVQDKEIAREIRKQGGPTITIATVKKARQGMKRPGRPLMIRKDLSEALQVLKGKKAFLR